MFWYFRVLLARLYLSAICEVIATNGEKLAVGYEQTMARLGVIGTVVPVSSFVTS